MAKIFSAIALIILLLTPLLIFAQKPPKAAEGCTMRHNLTGTEWENAGFKCPPEGEDCEFENPDYTCGACCVMDTIYTITNWFFIIVLAIAVILIIWGGVILMAAAGAPEKITSGRNIILFAIIGFIIALLAKAIPAIARNIMRI